MTRLMAVLFVLVISLFAADPADGVREASAGWRQAAIKKDTASLRRFLADDLTYFHADGKSQSKAGILRRHGVGRYESLPITQIRVYGKTAVLNGYVDVKMANQPYQVHKSTWRTTAVANVPTSLRAHQSEPRR